MLAQFPPKVPLRFSLHQLLIVTLAFWTCVVSIKAADVSISADALANRGRERLERGDAEGAEEDFSNAIKLDRRCAYAYFGRASLCIQKGDLDRAIGDYNRVVQLKPDWALGLLARGAALELKPDLTGAINDFTKAIELAKQDIAGYDARAYARLLKGDLAGAQSDCRQALRLDSRDVNALSTLAVISIRKGEPDKAIKACDVMIKINERFSTGYIIRAEARVELNELRCPDEIRCRHACVYVLLDTWDRLPAQERLCTGCARLC